MAKKRPAKTTRRSTPVRATDRTPRKTKKEISKRVSSQKRRETGERLQRQIRGKADALEGTKHRHSQSRERIHETPARVAPSAPRGARQKESTAYDRRNSSARAKGYESYWDERQSRVRARKALEDLGFKGAGAKDPETIAAVDQLGTLGRGESARELYYETRKILEKHAPSPSDRQIWSLIRIFYKPRGSHR
jgi:hypothetical protein